MPGQRFFPLFVIGLLLAPTMAQAQVGLRVQLEIERTSRRIQMAERVAADSDQSDARAELNEAMKLQAGAQDAARAGRPRIALDLTLRARQRADRAIAQSGRLPDPQRVLGQIERTQDLIDRSRPRVESCDAEPARLMLATAVEMQRRAQEAARAGRYLGALQLTMGARERIHQAMRTCHVDDDVDSSAEAALQRTDALIERARQRVGSDEVARRYRDRAIEIQGRAHTEFRNGRVENSVRLTLSARAFAFRALRRSGVED